jgi:outer membrane protein assembly factor BamD (BamD/ComL family)
MRLFLLLTLTILFLSYCSSNKKEFNLENETDESIHARAIAAYEAGQYAESFKYDSLLLIQFPISDLHIEAQLQMAKALGGQERYEDQLDLMLRLLKENIIPEFVPKIYLQLGEFYEHAAMWNPGNITRDSTDWDKAAQYYRKAVYYPNSKDNVVKAAAMYRAGLMYAKLNNFEWATNAYKEVVNAFPESPYSTLAKIKLQDVTNTSDISLETEAARQMEQERKSALKASSEEPAAPEPVREEQIGIVAPEDTSEAVQMEIGPEDSKTDVGTEIESQMGQEPVIPDTSAME